MTAPLPPHGPTRHWKLLSRAVLIGAAVVLAGSGCATITGAEARALVTGGALLLDVRTPAEFAEGHLEGAVNIPVQELEAKLASVPARKDQPIVVYCRSGLRSASARELLERAGFSKVGNLGAMSNWR